MHALLGVGDGTVALWDVRKLAQGTKPVASAGHSYSCQAAFFAPDGEGICCNDAWLEQSCWSATGSC
jgi:hypothetical protein